MESTIKLFKAVVVKSKRKKNPSKELLEQTIKRGFVFSPEVVYNYSDKELTKLIEVIEKEVGLTAEQMNSSFHKSWGKVRDAPIEQLIIEQLIHYFTTYGFEMLGIYNKDSVYVPSEKLEIPEIDKGGITLVVIHGYTKKELKDKLVDLLSSGIALHKDTIDNVVDVATFVKLNEKEIEAIKNKEVKIALYDYLGLFPENPVEFLRYAVYKSIGKTLLIKDSDTIKQIKDKKNLDILTLFIKYKKKYGLTNLAQIFYRFKPLFLAFKTNKRLNHVINQLRRLAEEHHKPMREDYLNSITSKIKNEEKIDKKELEKELSRVNTFRKIRLAYALKFRTSNPESILYRIRNGKGYATEFKFNQKNKAKTILDIVLDSITKDMKKNVRGKKIYIPEFITYTLPATEKQFTGDFPSGSYISIPKDMVMGIHWENVDGHRIDLDLSLINKDEGKIGWDSSYRTDDRSVLFSGDVTDAPKPRGASELFYVQRQAIQSSILLVNYYNYDDEVEAPFKIIVAKEQVKNFKNNYMVNPNNVVSIAKSKINQKQKILGLLVTTTNECRFYFTETYVGQSITSSNNLFVENSRKYLFDFYQNTISLNKILEKSGAKIVNEKEKCDIDLSPETLEKDTILNLLHNKPQPTKPKGL